MACGKSGLLGVYSRLPEEGLAADEAGDESESEEFFDVHVLLFLKLENRKLAFLLENQRILDYTLEHVLISSIRKFNEPETK